MYKLPSLIGLLLIFASCKQDANNKSQPPSSDSSLSSQQAIDTPGTNVPVTIKHEAYNEDIMDLPPALRAFAPEGYTALDTISGDLNLDRYLDMILVLKKNGEDTTSDASEHPEKRPLLILIGQADGNYKLAAKNDNAVYCIDCGGMMGDPFMNVVINKGYFSIEHYGGSAWRWTRTITFKYSSADNNWYLHKDGHESFNAGDPDKVETKIYTIRDFGKVPFARFDIYKKD